MTVNDLQDLIRLLDEHPEWKAELRQRLIEGDVQRIEALLVELAEGRRLDSERLRVIEELVKQNTEQIKQNSEQIKQVAELLVALERRTGAVEDRANRAVGMAFEAQYRDRPYAYFGSVLYKARTVHLDDLPGLADAYDDGRITAEQWKTLSRLDALITGSPRRERTRQVVVALEASITVDEHDIQRAAAGASILRDAGLDAIGAVAGESIREALRLVAERERVAVLIGGDVADWPKSA
jgi:hypothetical protein